MIKNEKQYRDATERLEDEEARIRGKKAALAAEGLSRKEIKRLTDPFLSFHLQLKEEVEEYEGLKRGEFAELSNLVGLGRRLVGLRVARGITQRDLAERLGVDESSISRDERNEYHGVTVERASRVLEALGAEARTTFRIQNFKPMSASKRR